MFTDYMQSVPLAMTFCLLHICSIITAYLKHAVNIPLHRLKNNQNLLITKTWAPITEFFQD